MQSELLQTIDGHRTFVVVLETGEEAITCLTDFARHEHINAASTTAIALMTLDASDAGNESRP